ncbi:ArsR family transcriptional regulator [Leptospira sp. 201903075]|uniref:ArsR family transcriptional regulator n=1 Tax=Leptospira chreensis TaxID=2810035 RepID=UPI001963B749|nr:ArsR family transcriptional regulator [Leptospira chreensis]MBM9592809.1 ArsR family transcriptional regulator [Leptospira chreensis]
MVLDGIFGNKTASRVLLHLYHYTEIHSAAIAQDYDTAVTPIRLQLERFEKVGIIVAKNVGRTRLFSFNNKSPFVKPIKNILAIFYESLSMEEKEKIFSTRRRPRQKGKPIYGRA